MQHVASHVGDESGTHTTISCSHSICDLWLGYYLHPAHFPTDLAYSTELAEQLNSPNHGIVGSDDIEKFAAELARLRKEYSDAIAYLPSYDQRQVDKVSQRTHIQSHAERLLATEGA